MGAQQEAQREDRLGGLTEALLGDRREGQLGELTEDQLGVQPQPMGDQEEVRL